MKKKSGKSKAAQKKKKVQYSPDSEVKNSSGNPTTQKNNQTVEKEDEKRRRGSLTDNSLGTSSSSNSSDEASVRARETMTEEKDTFILLEALNDADRQKLLTSGIGTGIAATGLADSNLIDTSSIMPDKLMLPYSKVVGPFQVDYEELYETTPVYRFDEKFFSEWFDLHSRAMQVFETSRIGPSPQALKLCKLILNQDFRQLEQHLPPCEPEEMAFTGYPKQKVLEEIFNALLFTPNQFTLIHWLCGRLHPSYNGCVKEHVVHRMVCNECHHSYCKILEMIFNHIPPELATAWLSRAETSKGRTPLHYLGMYGSTCILDVIRPFINHKMLNAKDNLKNSPIHYAVFSNNLPVLRWLMLTGSNVAFSSEGRRILDKTAMERECQAWEFTINRMTALERCMTAWVGYVYKEQVKQLEAISDIATIYLTQPKEKIDLELKARRHIMQKALKALLSPSVVKSEGQCGVMLFAVPVKYSELEDNMPDKYPHITRKWYIQKDGEVVNIFRDVLALGDKVLPLKSAQQNFETGTYSWFLTKEFSGENLTISMDIDASQVANFASGMILLQLFAVRVITEDPILPMPTIKETKEKMD